ncbi:MAG: S1 family peptidase [Labilithrix sp.]|nr:S1 family peptidase [Labilithrix sp.]
MFFAITACTAAPAEKEKDALRVASETSEIRGGEVDCDHHAVGILRLDEGATCSATLVAPDRVLTAAHCTLRAPKAFYLGRGQPVKSYQSEEATSRMARYAVRDIAAYPGFTLQTERTRCPFTPVDVGLVRLDETVTDVSPDPIAFAEPPPHAKCTSVGFGATPSKTGLYFHEKRNAIEIIAAGHPTAFSFDAHTGNTEPGDSGGPLYCDGAIVGVNSCKSNPDYFARLDSAREWLEAMLRDWDPDVASTYARDLRTW